MKVSRFDIVFENKNEWKNQMKCVKIDVCGLRYDLPHEISLSFHTTIFGDLSFLEEHKFLTSFENREMYQI